MISEAHPHAVTDPNLGRVLAEQYRIDALLEHGGMGAIYRGLQLSVNRPVAIKLIAANVERSVEHVVRFRREAEAMAKLRHPNTVRIFDFGVTEQGQLFMVMELLIGRDLEHYLAQVHVLTLPQALGIVRQVAQSLSEAHAEGIVHRDLKPANVFLSRVEGGDSFVKVMDFGIAGLDETKHSTQLTKAGAIVGTPAYMSPEQAQGLPVDGRADLYSLGIVLFEMLAGRSLFDATSAVSLLIAQITLPPPPIAEVCPKLREHKRVQALLDGLLAKSPEDRLTSAAELIEVIDDLLASMGPSSVVDVPALAVSFASDEKLPQTTHRTPLGATHRVPHAPRRRKPFALALAALAVCGAMLFFPTSRDRLSRADAEAPLAKATALWESSRLRAADLATRARQRLLGDKLTQVTIASIPTGASVRLDGAELGKTPYELHLKHATAIEVTVPGYAPAAMTITPDGEPNVIVKLVALFPLADRTAPHTN